MGRKSRNDESVCSNSKKSQPPFASVHLAWCVKRNYNSSSAPGWSGLVAIVSALAPRNFGGSSWVGRWNDGGLCAVLLCCCVMSVVVVVVVAVAVVLLFVCLLARVGLLCHPRGLVLGHAGGMPPTGANIAVLVLKTELTAGSSYCDVEYIE